MKAPAGRKIYLVDSDGNLAGYVSHEDLIKALRLRHELGMDPVPGRWPIRGYRPKASAK